MEGPDGVAAVLGVGVGVGVEVGRRRQLRGRRCCRDLGRRRRRLRRRVVGCGLRGRR